MQSLCDICKITPHHSNKCAICNIHYCKGCYLTHTAISCQPIEVVTQEILNKTDGYVYCFSNESMPGIVKVGMTERTPEARLHDANRSDTFKPPTPYVIEFAKHVVNPKEKEGFLHKLLEKYTERINLHREFFRIAPSDLRRFFDLMDGDYWIKKNA